MNHRLIQFSLLVAVIALPNMGCKNFGKSNDVDLDSDTGYYDDRAKPWVRDVTLGPDSPTSPVVDDYASQKLRNQLKTVIGQGPDQKLAMSLMAEGSREYEQANQLKAQNSSRDKMFELYDSAEGKFRNAANRWPKSSLEQDALFYAAECNFFSNRYPAANEIYKSLIDKYGGTRHMDVVQARRFAIAKYWLDTDRKNPDNIATVSFDSSRPMRDRVSNALSIFDQIRIDDPTGKLADDATLALANGYFEQGKFMDACDTYEDLRRTFSNSEHMFNAHMYELRARLEAYQGADYDGANLNKAEKLLRTLVTQFPTQAKEHREYLEKEASRVQHLLAEREMTMSNYYSRRGEFGAAKQHLVSIIEKYPRTSFAETARANIGDYQNKPSEPPQRLSWLVELFPEPKSTKPLIRASASDTLKR